MKYTPHDVARSYEQHRRQRHPFYKIPLKELTPGTETFKKLEEIQQFMEELNIDPDSFMFIMFQSNKVPSLRELKTKNARKKVIAYLQKMLPTSGQVSEIRNYYLKLLEERWGLSREAASELLEVV